MQPHRLQAEDKHLAICASCRSDLREAPFVAGSGSAFVFQKAAEKVIRKGYGYYGREKVSSQDWFQLLRYFLLLLRRVALGRADGLGAAVKALGITPDAILAPATGLAFELLPVEERAPLLMGAWEILDAGPEHLRTAAVQASLTRATFSGIYGSVPQAIAALVVSLPGSSIQQAKIVQPNEACQPRSRQSVMRMFARLQRKMARMP